MAKDPPSIKVAADQSTSFVKLLKLINVVAYNKV